MSGIQLPEHWHADLFGPYTEFARVSIGELEAYSQAFARKAIELDRASRPAGKAVTYNKCDADFVALQIARRFVPYLEPQRLAQLQVAIRDAICKATDPGSVTHMSWRIE